MRNTKMPSYTIVTGWDNFEKASPASTELKEQKTLLGVGTASPSSDTKNPAMVFVGQKGQPNEHFSNTYPSPITMTADEINQLSKGVTPPNIADDEIKGTNISFKSAENAFQYIKTKWMMNNQPKGDDTKPLTADMIRTLNDGLTELKTKGPDNIQTIMDTKSGSSVFYHLENPILLASTSKAAAKDEKSPTAAPAGPKHITAFHDIMTKVVTNKFLQNKDLAASLAEAGEKEAKFMDTTPTPSGLGYKDEKGVTQPGTNLLGNTLTYVARNNLADLKKVATPVDSKEASFEDKIKKSSSDLREKLHAYNKTRMQFPISGSDHTAEHKFHFQDSVLSKEIDSLMKNMKEKHSLSDKQLDPVFTKLKLSLKDFHQSTLQDKPVKLADVDKAFQDAQDELNKMTGDKSGTELKHIKEKNLEGHLNQLAQSLAAQQSTLFSAGVDSELRGQYRPKFAYSEEKLFDNPTASAGQALKKALAPGTYKVGEKGEESLFFINETKDQKLSISFNTSTVKDFPTHISRAIDTLWRNGNESITVGINNFNANKLETYLKTLETSLKAVTNPSTPPQPRNIRLNINPNTIAQIEAELAKESTVFGPNKKELREQYKNLQNALGAHNQRVSDNMSKFDSDVKGMAKKDLNSVEAKIAEVRAQKIEGDFQKFETTMKKGSDQDKIRCCKTAVPDIEKHLDELKSQIQDLQMRMESSATKKDSPAPAKTASPAPAKTDFTAQAKALAALRTTIDKEISAIKEYGAKDPALQSDAVKLAKTFNNLTTTLTDNKEMKTTLEKAAPLLKLDEIKLDVDSHKTDFKYG